MNSEQSDRVKLAAEFSRRLWAMQSQPTPKFSLKESPWVAIWDPAPSLDVSDAMYGQRTAEDALFDGATPAAPPTQS